MKQTPQADNLIFCLLLYIPVVWAALLIAQSLGGSLPDILANLTAAMEHPFAVRWTEHSLLSILACTGAYIMGLALYVSSQGRTRDGEEHGSAAWASPKQVNAMFAQKQNKLLTRNVRLGLDTHRHRRSLNVLVIGGSGAGKSRTYVKPNILEANTNYSGQRPKPLCCRQSSSCCGRRLRSMNRTFPWSCGRWSTPRCGRRTRSMSRRWIYCFRPWSGRIPKA